MPPLYEYLYTEMDNEIENAKPIKDINEDNKIIVSQSTTQRDKGLSEIVTSAIPKTVVIPPSNETPIIEQPKIESKSQPSKIESKSDSSTVNPQPSLKGKNIVISVDDSVIAKDR